MKVTDEIIEGVEQGDHTAGLPETLAQLLCQLKHKSMDYTVPDGMKRREFLRHPHNQGLGGNWQNNFTEWSREPANPKSHQ